MSVIAEQVGLTNKQQKFIDAYLTNGLNAADAARTAGYQGNAKQLSVIGNQNLNKLSIRQAIARRTQRDAVKADKRVINVYAEFEKNLDFVGKLRDACERWLADPDDPDTFSINPRGDEIDVVYFDYEDKDAQGNPKRKTESLQELLARLDGTRYNADATFVKTADIREFALKTIDRIDTTVDKFAKIEGVYTKDKENPADIKFVARTVAEFRERIKRDAKLYEVTNGEDGYPMPDEDWIEGEERKLLKQYKVTPEQLVELGRVD